MITESRPLSTFYSDPHKRIDRQATVSVSGDSDYIVNMYYEKNLILKKYHHLNNHLLLVTPNLNTFVVIQIQLIYL